MRGRRWVLASCLLAIALVASGCLGDRDSPENDYAQQAALVESQQRWQASGVVSYDYYLRKICFCPGGDGREVLISVRDGVIDRIRYADSGDELSADHYASYETVPDLFEWIQQAIDRSADSIQAEYDPSLGYPTFVFTDDSAGIADDEFQVDARDLTAI